VGRPVTRSVRPAFRRGGFLPNSMQRFRCPARKSYLAPTLGGSQRRGGDPSCRAPRARRARQILSVSSDSSENSPWANCLRRTRPTATGLRCAETDLGDHGLFMKRTHLPSDETACVPSFEARSPETHEIRAVRSQLWPQTFTFAVNPFGRDRLGRSRGSSWTMERTDSRKVRVTMFNK
jgi:hypothetical protein